MATEMHAARFATGLVAMMCLPMGVQADSTLERARELRQGLQQILQDPGPAAYASYFELWPRSLGEFQALFAGRGDHRFRYAVVLEQGMPEGSARLHFVHVCKAYDIVGAERYVEKFLRIAAEAGSWGGPPNRGNADLLMAGHLFQNLLFRADCLEGPRPDLQRAIVAVAARFDDAQLEDLYVSLGWNGMEGSGMEWFPMQWVLNSVCKHEPSRCALTRHLTAKYQYLIEE